MAEFEIVRPVEGATQVMFDYDAAGTAIDALVRMHGKMGDQATGRVGPRDAVLVNWQGHYRDEFETAWNQLQFRFDAAAEAATYYQGEIYTAISDANEMQRIFNQNAEDARNQPAVPAPTGPRGAY